MTSPTSNPPLVGHDDARDVLWRALDELTPGDGRGRGRVVLVRGEAGIGKTWTLDAAAEESDRRGHLVLRGSATEGGVSAPFGLWLPVVRQLLADPRVRGVRHRQPTATGHLAAVVPVFDAASEDWRDRAVSTPAREEQPFVLAEAIVTLLSSVSVEQRVVVFLDDLHWADADSLRVLVHVASQLGDVPVLLIGAHRPDPPSDYTELTELLASIRRRPDAVFVELQQLTADDLAAMLERQAGQPLADAVVRVIADDASGNPLYARELMRSLIERTAAGGSAFEVEDASSARAVVRDAGIPPGIREIVRQRLARLPTRTGELLRSMALVSGPTDVATVQRLADLLPAPGPDDATGWLESMDEALAAGLLRSVAGGFEFEHDIIKQAIGDEPNAARAAHRHRQLAEVLASGSDTANPSETIKDGRAFEIARQYHASAALDGATAGLPWCFRAADEATVAGAVRQTVTALRFGTDLLSGATPRDRADLLAALAMAEARALLWEEAVSRQGAVDAAFDAAGLSAHEQVEHVCRFAAAIKDAGAPRDVWMSYVQRGLGLSAPAGSSRVQRDADAVRDVWWARLQLLIDPVEPMRRGAVYAGRWTGPAPTAIAVVERDGDDSDLRLAVFPNDWRDETELDALVQRARATPDVAVRLHLLDTVGRSRLFRFGDHVGADEVLAECADEAEEAGAVAVQASALAMRTMCVSNLGDLPGADALWKHASSLADELGPAHRVRFVTGTLSAAWLGLMHGDGDFVKWAETATAMVLDEVNGLNAAGMSMASFVILCRGLSGDQAAVRALAPDVVALLADLPRDDYTVNGGCTAIAHGCFEADERGVADMLLVVVDDLLRAGRKSGPGGSLLMAKGQALALTGRTDLALECLAEAEAECARGGLTPVAALAAFASARVRLRTGDASPALQSMFTEVRSRFDGLGMSGWVDRLDAVAPVGSRPAATSTGAVPKSADRPGGLSKRELEVLRLLAVGRSNKEIAADLVVSVATSQRHVANIYIKLGVRNRAEATAWAYRNDIV